MYTEKLHCGVDLLVTLDDLDCMILVQEYPSCFENTTKASFAQRLYGVEFSCKSVP